MNPEITSSWMSSAVRLFTATCSVYQLYYRRKSPCIVRTLCPMLTDLIQENVTLETIRIISDISGGSIKLKEKLEFLREVPIREKEVISDMLQEGDVVLQIEVGDPKQMSGKRKRKSEEFKQLDAIEGFKVKITEYVSARSSNRLPILFRAAASPSIIDTCLESVIDDDNDNQNIEVSGLIDYLCKLDESNKKKIMTRYYFPSRNSVKVSLPSNLFHPNIMKALYFKGINQLYDHQLQAIESLLVHNKHVVITTSTASGKSLCYILPILQHYYMNRNPTAFLIFPTKALAQDQLLSLDKWIQAAETTLQFACYDGDTPVEHRKNIRNSNNIFLINPDILHVNILPNHGEWEDILRRLQIIVVDEAHVYKGTFGIHVALILRRLRRLVYSYGNTDLRVIVCSATMNNATKHACNLTGLEPSDFVIVDKDGSPSGKKEVVFWNPFGIVNKVETVSESNQEDKSNSNKNSNSSDDNNSDAWTEADSNDTENKSTIQDTGNFSRQLSKQYTHSPYVSTAMLVEHLIKFNIRTLIFVKARHIAEMLLQTIRHRLPVELQHRVGTYRGGYLSEDRRDIESKLKNGILLAVVTTNALELGIDVGALECTVHLGYPGSKASFMQQAGRAGRNGQDSLAIYMALHSPLEQFFMTNPMAFFDQNLEAIALNVSNPILLEEHLICSAFESSFLWPISPNNTISPPRDNNEHINSNLIQLYNTGNPLEWFGDRSLEILSSSLKRKRVEVIPNGSCTSEYHVLVPLPMKSIASTISIRGVDSQRTVIIIDMSYRVSATSANDGHDNNNNTTESSSKYGKVLETMEYSDALLWLYEGAVYLHHGRSYVVQTLDVINLRALVVPKFVDYYTEHLGHLSINILSTDVQNKIYFGNIDNEKIVSNLNDNEYLCSMLRVGPVEVTKRVFKYRMRDKRTSEVVDVIDVLQPEYTYQSRAVWCDIPTVLTESIRNIYQNQSIKSASYKIRVASSSSLAHIVRNPNVPENGSEYSIRYDELYERYGLHAVEHLLCALAPTMVPCDTCDLSCQHTRRVSTLYALNVMKHVV